MRRSDDLSTVKNKNKEVISMLGYRAMRAALKASPEGVRLTYFTKNSTKHSVRHGEQKTGPRSSRRNSMIRRGSVTAFSGDIYCFSA